MPFTDFIQLCTCKLFCFKWQMWAHLQKHSQFYVTRQNNINSLGECALHVACLLPTSYPGEGLGSSEVFGNLPIFSLQLTYLLRTMFASCQWCLYKGRWCQNINWLCVRVRVEIFFLCNFWCQIGLSCGPFLQSDPQQWRNFPVANIYIEWAFYC